LKKTNSVQTNTTFRIVGNVMAGIGLWGSVGIGLCGPVPQFNFNIGAGRLVDQLSQFAGITQQQMVFDYDALEAVTTRGVRGRYSADNALSLLVKGKKILCEHGRNSITIRPSKGRRAPTSCWDLEPQPVAQIVGPQALPPQSEDAIAVVRVFGDKTGSHLQDGRQIGVALLSVHRQEIRESGATNVADLFSQTTQNFFGGATEDTHTGPPEAISNSGLGFAGNLRGAGARATLFLLNNVPTATSGSSGGFYDTMGYPLAAIERFDIAPDGSSAIYGAAAVGGVVNVHTLQRYDRPETDVAIGSVTRGRQEQHRLSQLLGKRWDDGEALIVGELLHRGALDTRERWQANAFGPAGYVPYTSPGNLETSDRTIYPIPQGQAGRPLDFSSLSPGAPSVVNPWVDARIVPNQTRWSLYTSAHQNLGDSASVWSNTLCSWRHAVQTWGGQEVTLHVQDSPLLLHAPTGEVTETYNLLNDLGPKLTSVWVETCHATLGIQVPLSGGWHMVFRGSYSREHESQLNGGQLDPEHLQAGIDSGAFDPFGAGANNSSDVLATVQTPQWYHSLSRLGFYQAIAEGRFFSIGAGPWQEALGVEFQDQGLRSADPAIANNLRRQVRSAFLEIEAPLLDADRFPAPFRNLSVSLAERYEHYSDFAQSVFVPRFGFEWSALEHFTLRGTWGWSVRAPLLGDLSSQAGTSVPYTLGSIPVLIWSGGNPQLRLEWALTRTLGMKLNWEDNRSRFTAAIGYFDMVYQHRIDQPEFESNILSDKQYTTFVVQNPTRALLQKVCDSSNFPGGSHADCLEQQVSAILDLRLHNLNTLWTDGIDAETRMSFESRYGTLGVDVRGTYVLDYAQSRTPGGSLVSFLNQESEPIALHLFASGSWQLGPVKAIVSVHNTGRYRDTETDPITRVGAWTTTDIRLSYTFGFRDTAPSRLVEVAAYCQNVLNKLPPFSINTLADRGYDEENGDLSGRTCTASAHLTW